MSHHTAQSHSDDSSESTNPYEVDPSQLMAATIATTRVRLRTQVSKRSNPRPPTQQHSSTAKKAKTTQGDAMNSRNDQDYDEEFISQQLDDNMYIPPLLTIGTSQQKNQSNNEILGGKVQNESLDVVDFWIGLVGCCLFESISCYVHQYYCYNGRGVLVLIWRYRHVSNTSKQWCLVVCAWWGQGTNEGFDVVDFWIGLVGGLWFESTPLFLCYYYCVVAACWFDRIVMFRWQEPARSEWWTRVHYHGLAHRWRLWAKPW